MTERLYYTSDAAECRARVVNCLSEADGRYAIELDRTLFHPQGGGQPADRGWIADVAVESVIVRGDSIAHIVSQPLALDEVAIRIDIEARQIHARLHSAGHLLGQAGESFGWQPIKAHHWPGEGRITFAAGANAVLPEASMMLEKVETWQAENLPRQVSFTDGLRKVGFGDMLSYPCGGTHVATLSELGKVIVTQVKMKKGQMIVSYTLE
ncbi:alanyl-tRNA editing protein [Klebsiella sp. RHBSTW-00484]|uniref:alanyl-tRNA editing protein n=1 Tax=unclassified Klebsiella TaxID=2608929 RepID=UPI0015E589DF|nr:MULTISPECIES: alanyl-tRNA editing protein [unclassified Klebsiella]MBA7843383.1 alanyl-tRNA editing protein [Klebsiella sp. RHBSTW-00465]QLO38751.1 alanyl-tRNA editing protein [Klebsiella sp. RHBSTW-00484]QLT78271.1 alanyl-tRNA editing protein [Klebsiella sp. RHBSTW-00464]